MVRNGVHQQGLTIAGDPDIRPGGGQLLQGVGIVHLHRNEQGGAAGRVQDVDVRMVLDKERQGFLHP
jgi:hypothetical protein